MISIPVFYRDIMGADVVICTKDISDKKHDQEDEKAESRYCPVDEHVT